MKFKKPLSLLLAGVMLTGSATIAASAATAGEAVGAYSNKSYLETYASSAYNETGLGATYSAASTTFKTWSPEATKVQVKLYRTGSDSESGAGVIGTYDMTKNSTTGVWSYTLSGDHKNEYYTYVVTAGGSTNETQDVYSKATGVDGDRSMIVDLDSTDPDGWENDNHVVFDNAQQAIVWEGHVRDFSIADNSGVSEDNRGTYLAFTEGGTTYNGASTCIDYLVEEGINCVQLQPVYDFGSVNEAAGASSSNRNWGYDPENYNVPEGSYSTNAFDGNVRINEFKQMVQALHDRGISVVMDVVYNHTYSTSSCFNKTVPGYYYRLNNGAYNNGSGCGNETASDKLMFRKYMIESVAYWAEEYHIDGFRFDLMSLHDRTTMNAIRSKLDSLGSYGSKILMYGEPWSGDGSNGLCPEPCTQSYASSLDARVGMFCDSYRDALRGSNSPTKGFIQGNTSANTSAVVNGVKGKGFSAKAPSQTIAYADAHDNYILWDQVVKSNGSSAFTGTNANYQNQAMEAMTLLLTSQGIPFMTAGSEFGRTKKGDENSYNSSDAINQIDWARPTTMSRMTEWYKGLAKVRKNFSPLKSSTFTTPTFVSDYGDVVGYYYNNSTSGEWSKLCVLVNGGTQAWPITTGSSGWKCIMNSVSGTTISSTGVNLSGLQSNIGSSVSVPAKGSIVLVQGSCAAAEAADSFATLTVNHVDEGGAVLKTQSAKYRAGSTYRALPDTTLLFDYILKNTTGETTGTAVAGQNYTVTFTYGSDGIPSGYVNASYVDQSGNSIADAYKVKLKAGNSYAVPIVSVLGYELDTDSIPANLSGTFTGTTLNFTLKYKPLANTTTLVHYYNSNGWSASALRMYAYVDSNGSLTFPNGSWGSEPVMTSDSSTGSNWYKSTINVSAARVMFHTATDGQQEPGQNEPGYLVAGETWIQNKTVTYNVTVVTSHIDLATGQKLSADVTTTQKVASTDTYTTSPLAGRTDYITPANATGQYTPGTINVVYLYGEGGDTPIPTTTQPPTTTEPEPTTTEPEPTTTEPGPRVLIGDADLNGVINIIDVTTIQKIVASLLAPTSDQRKAADTDGDGSFSIVDATLVQKYIAKLGDSGNVGNYYGETPATDPTETDPIETDPIIPLDQDFYLIGYFNGADYGDGTDYASLGDCHFVNNQVVVQFAQTSYACVKTATGTWYMTNGFPGVGVTEADLLNTSVTGDNSDKLEVPAGTYTFTLVKTGDDTYHLSYVAGGDNPVVIPTTIVNPSDPTNPTDPSGTYTLYFTQPSGWSTPYCYWWAGDEEGPVAWPGTEMTFAYTNDYSEAVYKVDVPTAYNKVIFNDGTNQTVDITTTCTSNQGYYVTDGEGNVGEWTYTGEGGGTGGGGGTDETYTLYFTQPSGWNVPNCYYWTGDSDGPVAWPGTAMTFAYTNDYGEAVYNVSVPSTYEKVIFNDGTNQTVDITTTCTSNQGYYVTDGEGNVGEWTYSGGSGSGSGTGTGGGTTDSYTLYFTQPSGWNVPNCYYWTGDSDGPVAWPGTAMTFAYTNDYGEAVYNVSVPSTYEKVIFNDGTNQTVDITTTCTSNQGYYVTDGEGNVGEWTYSGESGSGSSSGSGSGSGTSGTYTVRFTQPSGWGTPYVHYWTDGGDSGTQWPGAAMTWEYTNDYGENVYKIDIPTQYNMIIFSNNGSSQTGNIQTSCTDCGYYLSNGNAVLWP